MLEYKIAVIRVTLEPIFQIIAIFAMGAGMFALAAIS
jgi:hypothetical protein